MSEYAENLAEARSALEAKIEHLTAQLQQAQQELAQVEYHQAEYDRALVQEALETIELP